MRFLSLAVRFLPFALPFYLVRFQIGPLPTTLLEVYLISLIALFSLSRGLSGWHEGWKRLGSWRWPVAAWLVASLIAAFVSPDLRAGLGLWRAYVLEPLLVFLILSDVIRTEAQVSSLRQSLFLTVPLLSLWAFVQFLTGWGIPHPWDVAIDAGRRATGPFPYPNALALFVTPIAAWAFARWARRFDNIELLAWTTGLLAILLAKSDGGLVAFVAVAFLVLIAERRFRSWTIGATVALVVFILAIPAIREPVVSTLTFQGWSGQVRLFQWRETREMLKDHPFFGAGFGGYPTVFQPYHKATAIEIFQYPHNILLNFWSETGILGVLAFAWIVATWFRRGRSLVVFAPLIAILIHGLVDVPYFKNDLAIVFWILALLTTLDPKGQER